MPDLEVMEKEAEQIQAEIIAALNPLGARELLDIWQYIVENHWTATEEQKQALEREETD